MDSSEDEDVMDMVEGIYESIESIELEAAALCGQAAASTHVTSSERGSAGLEGSALGRRPSPAVPAHGSMIFSTTLQYIPRGNSERLQSPSSRSRPLRATVPRLSPENPVQL